MTAAFSVKEEDEEKFPAMCKGGLETNDASASLTSFDANIAALAAEVAELCVNPHPRVHCMLPEGAAHATPRDPSDGKGLVHLPEEAAVGKQVIGQVESVFNFALSALSGGRVASPPYCGPRSDIRGSVATPRRGRIRRHCTGLTGSEQFSFDAPPPRHTRDFPVFDA